MSLSKFPAFAQMVGLLHDAAEAYLVSLTAPVHPEPVSQLFRWDNDFAWSYVGNVADSIRERVKKAGGKVDGAVLRVSLSWFNFDDLDLHVYEPPGRGKEGLRDHIWFGNKRGWTGGALDVDMNAGHGTTREAVENVTWAAQPPDGAYMSVNIFEYAVRNKLRFASPRGELPVEQLWDVPLRSRDGFDLNAVAGVRAASTKLSSERPFHALLAVLEHDRREAALEVVKQDGKLSDLSEKELARRIAALDSAE